MQLSGTLLFEYANNLKLRDDAVVCSLGDVQEEGCCTCD